MRTSLLESVRFTEFRPLIQPDGCQFISTMKVVNALAGSQPREKNCQCFSGHSGEHSGEQQIQKDQKIRDRNHRRVKPQLLEQSALPCVREERNFLELILKLETALSNVEESDHSSSFRTGSSKNALRHEADPANQLERCSSDPDGTTVPPDGS
ncbi:hypothetical protein [Thalassoglobus polymorphus]|uniref:Uncharacterized protein n=1 Tax=Thalassoglobus polymorphus TaxID=2527994 RepID=A0A517QNG0_9PLAN|nr:hypothetical protein [Thalassoglobus polymorphus]QDT33171.1 hypothetical protein Mal48_24240 [Thalassoglobus polymorphus]